MRDRIDHREWRWVVLVALTLVVVSSLPYLLAWALRPEEMHFTGLLVNPWDGHSYITKMRQGLDGNLRFRLAFTPEPQEGAYLFLLHIALGYVARWTGLPLIAVYHGSRMLAGAILLLTSYRFILLFGGEGRTQRRLAFLLLGISSGFGWLAVLAGYRSSDLWVPEAFVFYAILDTLHFPLAIALMMVILMALARPDREPAWREGLTASMASIGLGVVQPFGVIPVYATLAIWLALRWLRDRQMDWRAIGWIAAHGLIAILYPLYGVWAIQNDPVLAGWSAQNQTPSPPVWDWLLSFGVMTVLAVPGVVRAVRRRSNSDLLLLAWVIAAGVGMYTPLALQRRLALGLQIPIALLAARGWRKTRSPITVLLWSFSSLTNWFLMAIFILAALSGEPRYYLGDDEWQAMTWLRENVGHEQVVLCAPQTGMFVPAWAGQRVVYGHPFETVDAERRGAQVAAYWSGEMRAAEQEAFLQENRVGYIFVGPRERRLEEEEQRGKGARNLVFEAGDVKIYEVRR